MPNFTSSSLLQSLRARARALDLGAPIAFVVSLWWLIRSVIGITFWIGLTALAYLVYAEMQSADLQARYLHQLNKDIHYSTVAGPSKALRFPKHGPYDERLGYVQLPDFIRNLEANGFEVKRQATWSPRLLDIVERGMFPTYHEKTQAGLSVFDKNGEPLFEARFPERVYADFEAAPRVLIDTLLFIENRELLDATQPKKNPAVEWDRLAKAVLDQAIHAIDPDQDTPGGSTLATQIEKYRHSPEGRTGSIGEKFRQMASASIRAYSNGEQTMAARRQLAVDYLNTVPLAAKPGVGEVNGIGDGLWAWYGRDFNDVSRILHQAKNRNVGVAEQGKAYKQALSLMISQRRPSYYLPGNPKALNELSDSHLRVLAQSGIISPSLRDAALAYKLQLNPQRPKASQASFVTRKAATAVRTDLARVLKTAGLYDLDRLDLSVTATLDRKLQGEVTSVLRSLRDPEQAKAAGLLEPRMLEAGDPAKLIYSFTLFERTPIGNMLRVQTDNYDQPFDINEGAKLDLGSTAKLRTLISYLEVVAAVHADHGQKTPDELKAVETDERDYLTRWVLDQLALSTDRTLLRLLEAAMQRRYSASPGEPFFTGGGQHTFSNFNPDDNSRVMDVHEAFRNSVNLVFIRMMRDVVRHYMFNAGSAKVLSDAQDPRRRQYLERFADREGKTYINRFYGKYQGKSAEEAEELLLHDVRRTRDRLSAVFRTIEPAGDEAALGEFLAKHLNDDKPSDEAIKKLANTYDPDKMNLADRGYVAGVHPLELWLVGHLRAHPGATLKSVTEASKDERQAVYAWLFKTRNKNTQDRRILNLLEIEGFLEIHRTWARLGYPFASLVPSYATALGSSADRPAALAELMGILLNDGVRMPTVNLVSLHFAADTPYDTKFGRAPMREERVLAPEITRVVRRALMDVATNGTAKRLRDTYVHADSTPVAVGGKTGTGDNRFDSYGARGQLLKSRVVSRSATFAFFLGEHYFGTITAYVAGEEAANYKFTSSLVVQIFKNLATALAPLLKNDKSVLEFGPIELPPDQVPYPALPTPQPLIPKDQPESPEGVVPADQT